MYLNDPSNKRVLMIHSLVKHSFTKWRQSILGEVAQGKCFNIWLLLYCFILFKKSRYLFIFALIMEK
jgi:hypothetical protein